ncbi:MAG: choice-of-anchor D domain-containing protein, partial [Ilumatobacteraceae bacterium]
GSSDQVGNELDEFTTETLRNNLLGLPLDLPTLNMTRAREAGVPSLNNFRKKVFNTTADGELTPYTSWADFGQHLKHRESLINFVAAYGKHPSITGTRAQKRAAAKAIVDPDGAPVTPVADRQADADDFMFSTGTWATGTDGVSKTGVDNVDLWVGGLAENTNLGGGLLGSTFNYVFQSTMENLQDGDRLYYLKRTPGLNLRNQLEGNSFSELMMRNTDGTHSLHFDSFSTADCKFELKNLGGTGSTVADDPLSECDESKLLLRQPNGTIQYRLTNTVDPPGINGQSVYNGTNQADRVHGGLDNDTFWTGIGNDVIEGGNGSDVALAGLGNDIITDLNGDDVPKGGQGNDAINAGPGLDIIHGGAGKDFINGGSGDNETFAGEGDDYIFGGSGLDGVFGDGGSDWIQGGASADLLQGDHGSPFFDDPGEKKPGNDILIGQAGETDYDAEGGDDIMTQSPVVERNAGSAGFDWATHQYDTVAADDDMAINANLEGLPVPVVVNRDRWQETEANSGSKFDDVIRGDDSVPGAIGGAGFAGCNVLDQEGVNRIGGLNAIVPQPLTGDSAPVIAASAAGRCPITGPIWGEGNILLGGPGSDTITGRGGDDIIDGDKELKVRISVRPGGTEIGSADLMESQYKRDTSGALTGNTLQTDVFNGTINPGDLAMVREIVSPPAGDTGVDTAVFAGPRANYTIAVGATSTKVTQTGANVTGQKVTDGIDTVRNVEQLRFSDQTVAIGPGATMNPTALAFGDRPINTDTTQTTTLTNSGNSPLTITSIGFQAGSAPEFTRPAGAAGGTCAATTVAAGATCTVIVNFRATATGAKSGTLRIAHNAPGGQSLVGLTANGVPNGPIASFSTATQAFGNQTVNTTSAQRVTVLTNTGNATLNMAITLVGTNLADFARVNGGGTANCGNTLAAGASCNITNTFTPLSGGAKTATMQVRNTTTNTVAGTFGLTGTGQAGGIGLASGANLSGTTLSFGSARAGLLGLLGGTVTRTLTVSSTGPGSLVLGTLVIGGTNANNYSVTRNTCGTTPVAVGSTCQIDVRFAPNATGTRTGTLRINSNIPAGSTTLNLTGTGT